MKASHEIYVKMRLGFWKLSEITERKYLLSGATTTRTWVQIPVKVSSHHEREFLTPILDQKKSLAMRWSIDIYSHHANKDNRIAQ